MKILIDAQLPRRMATWFVAAGVDAIHTLELPDENRTTDDQILDVAERDERIVATKDADFVDSHVLRCRPEKLLLVSTGNITNLELEQLVRPLIPDLLREFSTNSFLEIGRDGILIRG